MASSEILAYDGTKTRRKEHRRDVRNVLGTSSDAAPNAVETLRAARSLSALLLDATAGTMELVVKVRAPGQLPLTFHEAIARVNAATDARGR